MFLLNLKEIKRMKLIIFKAFILGISILPVISNPHNLVEYITSDSIITQQLAQNALIRKEAGFEKDFLVLHCLLKQFNPKKIFEIGTCEGYGTAIMANACPHSTIISLDLPPYTPPFNLKPEQIGYKCKSSYIQIFSESLQYNYAQHFPIDAWFIDGAHDYHHVQHETLQAVASNAILIVYHDTDIEEVLKAITDTLANTPYKIYRVTDTRISYAIKAQ